MRGLCSLFVTYVCFQVLYYLNLMVSFRLNGFDFDALPVKVFHPDGQAVTWFMLALLIWRTALPLVSRMRRPIAVSLALGSLAVFVDLGVNFQNIASFMPYFVVGSRLPRSLWASQLSRPHVRFGFASFFLCVSVAMLLFSTYGGDAFAACFSRLGLTYACFNGAPPAEQAGECSTFRELCMRLIFYASSVPLITGFLCALPTGRGVWTVPGYMSIYVYLIYPLVLFNPIIMHFTFELFSHLYGREVNVWSPATKASALGVVAPVAMLFVAALSTPATRAVFWPLVEPPIDALFIADDERGGGGGGA